jgi:hypothetical protein
VTRRSTPAALCLGGLLVLTLILAFARAALASPALSRPLEGAAAIAVLNEQRAANGIPPVTTIEPAFASWCPNEGTGVIPGEVGQISASGNDWGPDKSPWDFAPLHQGVEYDPLLMEAGDAYAAGTSCMGLGGERATPETPATYAYLGDEGPRNVPHEIAVPAELPYSPQEIIGIPDGTRTGPQLLFFVYGLGVVHAGSWSLSTAGGVPVPGVRMVDSAAAAAAGKPGYFPNVGWMIPPRLQPGTAYNGSVSWVGTTGDTTQAFSFKTSVLANTAGLFYQYNTLHAQTEAPGAYIVFSKGRHTLRFTISPSSGPVVANWPFHLSRLSSGTWHVCVFSGGGTTGYEAKKGCLQIKIRHHRAV